MHVVGIGVDLVDVGRIRRILSDRTSFVRRVFSEEEITYCEHQAQPAECYAARWAAREACRKALGGIPGMRWQDVRVKRATTGAPTISLSGGALHRARELGVADVLVALTHERTMAGAFCLAMGT